MHAVRSSLPPARGIRHGTLLQRVSSPQYDLQEVKPELEKESAPSEKVYEKDDFFDKLSCEALERLNVGGDGAGPGQTGKLPLRTRFAEQRKLDIETFGGTGIARRNNYGRGHGRRGR